MLHYFTLGKHLLTSLSRLPSPKLLASLMKRNLHPLAQRLLSEAAAFCFYLFSHVTSLEILSFIQLSLPLASFTKAEAGLESPFMVIWVIVTKR